MVLDFLKNLLRHARVGSAVAQFHCMGQAGLGLCGGEYIGPKLFGAAHEYPALVRCNARARDPHIAARLWEISERLTGVRYAI